VLLDLAVPLGQITDELVELAVCLGVVAAFEALLELRQVEATLGVAVAKALGYAFAVGVGGAEVWVATRDPFQEVLVGHLGYS
jgi:hypothetical protein